MTTRQKTATDLLEKGYFSFPNTNADIANNLEMLTQAWNYFCRQPLLVKQRHEFGGPQDNGYEFKDQNSLDYKENFHLSLSYIAPRGSTFIDQKFISAGKRVLESLASVVLEVARIINEASGFDLSEMMLASQENWVLRSLHYFADVSEMKRDLLAAPHIDKGVTIHLCEDTGGLQILWNGVWIDIPETEGFFHGYCGMLGQYHTECILKALCHRVIANQKTRKKGRISHVVFIDFANMRYDKAIFGSTQKVFPSGENYEMPFSEFKKYFKPIEVAVTN